MRLARSRRAPLRRPRQRSHVACAHQARRALDVRPDPGVRALPPTGRIRDGRLSGASVRLPPLRTDLRGAAGMGRASRRPRATRRGADLRRLRRRRARRPRDAGRHGRRPRSGSLPERISRRREAARSQRPSRLAAVQSAPRRVGRREHALAWALARSTRLDELHAAPGESWDRRARHLPPSGRRRRRGPARARPCDRRRPRRRRAGSAAGRRSRRPPAPTAASQCSGRVPPRPRSRDRSGSRRK